MPTNVILRRHHPDGSTHELGVNIEDNGRRRWAGFFGGGVHPLFADPTAAKRASGGIVGLLSKDIRGRIRVTFPSPGWQNKADVIIACGVGRGLTLGLQPLNIPLVRPVADGFVPDGRLVAMVRRATAQRLGEQRARAGGRMTEDAALQLLVGGRSDALTRRAALIYRALVRILNTSASPSPAA